jgi:Papain family cysteine protease/Domain of unknown function (DUF4384)
MYKKSLYFLFYLLPQVLSAQGLKLDDAAYERVALKPEADSLRGIQAGLPCSTSLKRYCPKVGNQKPHSTCVAWSVGYAARTILYAKSRNLQDKDSITQQAFSPDFLYKRLEPNETDCKEGIGIPPTLDSLQKIGIVFKKQLATCPLNIPDSLLKPAQAYKIEDFVRLFDKTDALNIKIKRIQKSLSEGNPVVIGMYYPPSFETLRSEIWRPTERVVDYSQNGHAICVIGYDSTKFGGAFEIQNSWGDNWANDGFCWVKYEDLATWTAYGFELINNIRPVGEAPRDSLVGDIQLRLENNSEMKVVRQSSAVYRTSNPYTTGTKFKVVLNNHEPAYVYAFSTDASFKMVALFPHHPKISAALTYKTNQITLPASEYFALDSTVGVDIFCMLYSKTSLDFEQLLKDLEKATGDFQQRLNQVIGNQLIMKKHVKYELQDIQFKSDLHGKDMVPIMVKIPHH